MKRLNKQGAYTDIFMFIILAVSFVFISVIMIYASHQIYQKLKVEMPKIDVSQKTALKNMNYTKTMEQSIAPVNQSYGILPWASAFIIIFMIIAIWMGSYMVVTRPVYFIPYIIICIIAVIVSFPISSIYDSLSTDSTLGSTFARFSVANFIFAHFPIWITIISISGGIIMYIKMQKGEEQYAYG